MQDQHLKYAVYDRQIIIRADDSQPNKTVSGQTKEVKGKITTASGDPIPGATVVIKGTTNGIISDADGSFVIGGVRTGDVLVVSFVGMVSQEIVYQGESSLV